ncbi:hypothetical protein WJX73_008074 [Symbiochloris irregularis]|uniref:Uncharacterized protein n=1 Tax=Symbiochloris irregularis TaxID=706552 RepID=A0AAW1PIJ0_9CHLO
MKRLGHTLRRPHSSGQQWHQPGSGRLLIEGSDCFHAKYPPSEAWLHNAAATAPQPATASPAMMWNPRDCGVVSNGRGTLGATLGGPRSTTGGDPGRESTLPGLPQAPPAGDPLGEPSRRHPRITAGHHLEFECGHCEPTGPHQASPGSPEETSHSGVTTSADAAVPPQWPDADWATVLQIYGAKGVHKGIIVLLHRVLLGRGVRLSQHCMSFHVHSL